MKISGEDFALIVRCCNLGKLLGTNWKSAHFPIEDDENQLKTACKVDRVVVETPSDEIPNRSDFELPTVIIQNEAPEPETSSNICSQCKKAYKNKRTFKAHIENGACMKRKMRSHGSAANNPDGSQKSKRPKQKY